MLSAYTCGVAATAFVAEVVYGTTSFGPAIVFHIGMHLLSLLGITEGTVQAAVVSMVWPMFSAALVQSITLGRGCHWRLLCVGGIFTTAGTLAGTAALFVVGKSIWLKRCVGFLLLLLWSHRMYKHWRRHKSSSSASDGPPLGAAPDPTRGALLSVVLCFSASGLLGGVTGLAGPPLMIFVAQHERELNMKTWRSTSAILRLAMGSARVTYMLTTGALQVATVEAWINLVVLVVCSLSGLAVGNILSNYLKPSQFQLAVLWMLFSASVLLATADFQPAEEIAQWVVLAAAPAALMPTLLAKVRRANVKPLARSDAAREKGGGQ